MKVPPDKDCIDCANASNCWNPFNAMLEPTKHQRIRKQAQRLCQEFQFKGVAYTKHEQPA